MDDCVDVEFLLVLVICFCSWCRVTSGGGGDSDKARPVSCLFSVCCEVDIGDVKTGRAMVLMFLKATVTLLKSRVEVCSCWWQQVI